MMNHLSAIIFHNIAAWWIAPSVVIGFLYAWLLYSPNRTLSSTQRILFVIRLVTVSFIAFLLSAPLLSSSNRIKEKPLIVFALDQSASMMIGKAKLTTAQLPKNIESLKNTLGSDYNFQTLSFGSEIHDSLTYTYKNLSTDFSQLFNELNNRYMNRNLGALILISDGIYNKGENPVYQSPLKAPIYAVAMGDSRPKRDLCIATVNYNKIAYLGNDFQIEIAVEGRQCMGTHTLLTVTEQGKTVFSKLVAINSTDFRVIVPVTLTADKEGLKSYKIALSPIEKEISLQNNAQTLFIEVLNGKEKILLLADAPHPDLAAIKQAIESNANYEVKIVLADNFDQQTLAKYNLIILHQLPNTQALLNKLDKSRIPIWYIIGNKTDFNLFNQSQSLITVSSNGAVQEVLPRLNNDFFAFTLTDVTRNRLQKLGPLLVPFGNYSVNGQIVSIFNQKIKNIETNTPLLFFGVDKQTKIGVLLGEGIWHWRLEDFQDNGTHQAVDEWLSKTVKYLSSKEDKRKFRVYPVQNTFDENEDVVINAELYNDAYELVNTPDVSVNIKNHLGKTYTFLFSRTSNAYVLNAGILPPDSYSFVATTKLGTDKNHVAKGKFVIAQQNIEYKQTTANHQLLYTLAKQTGGGLLKPTEFNAIADSIRKNDHIKTISYDHKRYSEILDQPWLLVLIVTLLAVEWFVRKRNGEA